ncbi:hypothetical protein VKT23_013824 [Stygiomarasmius scandens]|uniref:DUF1348-domain-containing protein n=1 Tax=Marasmiellus scandens TaxID=2682957 RepID=A0ABR1J5K5_9AGAR
MSSILRPPLPPFTFKSALQKVKAAQALWNTRDPTKVALAYTEDTVWRNRADFVRGREDVEKWLKRKWEREHWYILRKDLFAFTEHKIAVQFFYEWNDKPDASGQWHRTYGLEDWTFAPSGLMYKRMMSGNDLAIRADERWFEYGPEDPGKPKVEDTQSADAVKRRKMAEERVDTVNIGEEHL